MANKRDYYEVLGVTSQATDDEIKKAYRKLAKQYHPDVSTDPNATEKFKEVQAAYDCLSDPTKRSNYDQFGSEEPNPFSGGGGSGGFGGFEDILNSFFGGQRRSNQTSARKGRDLQIRMDLTFEEAAFGVKKTITLDRFEECHHCNGIGAESYKDVSTCQRCHGTGRVIVEQSTIFGRMQSEATCPECQGRGKKISKLCTKCNGQGRVKKRANIVVDVAAGIDNEQTIRLSGQGEAGINGGPAGDLYVIFYVKDHEFFERDMYDIYLSLPITFSQAALGAEIEVKTLHGKVKLSIPAGTQTGTKFKMTGKGIHAKSGRKGNQIVVVNVITPTNLTKEQKELFNKLQNTDETANNRFFDRVKKWFKGE